MALLFALSAWRFSTRPYVVLTVDLLSFYLLTISVIDYQHKIIPDELSFSLLGIGWVGSFWNPYLQGHYLPTWAESLLAALAGGVLMLCFAWGGEKIFKKEALGGGDVKLMAAFGAVFGWSGLIGSLLIGSFIGSLGGGGLLLLKRKKRGDTIPYGPFLCLGAFITSFLPPAAMQFLFS
jgi:leader peptidase (prepilin peptidase)/N-methyltransferase